MVEMAPRETKNLKVGEIIDRTVDTVSATAVPAIIFVIVFGVLGLGVDYLALQMQQQMLAQGTALDPSTAIQTTLKSTGLSLVFAVAMMVGLYHLIGAMLRQSGLLGGAGGGNRYLPFIGMSILSGLGVVVGLILFIIPGLIFMARWSIAPALMIGGGKGAIESLGESWERTKGNELSIILAAIAMTILFYLIAFAPSFMFSEAGVLPLAFGRLGSTIATVISTGMGVALYGLLGGSKNVSATFE